MNIIYVAHTKERIWRDTRFSILTLLEYLPLQSVPVHIWLFTDNPEYFDFSEVEVIPIDQNKLAEWYGEINFIHRQKLMAIEYVAARSEGNLMMLDGDVLFRQDPAPLFASITPSISFMYQSEGAIKSLKTKSGKLLQQMAQSGKFPGLELGTVMFNAGVIAFHRDNLPIETEVLTLTEQLYRAEPLHIMEQLAHSIVLQKYTSVQESDAFLFHWWGRGKNVEPILVQFFEQMKGKSPDELLPYLRETKTLVEQAKWNRKKSPVQKLVRNLKKWRQKRWISS